MESGCARIGGCGSRSRTPARRPRRAPRTSHSTPPAAGREPEGQREEARRRAPRVTAAGERPSRAQAARANAGSQSRACCRARVADPDEDAGGEQAGTALRAGRVAHRRERRRERQQHQHLGGRRVHVVSEEARAVDEVEQPGQDAPAVVPEEGARRERGQGQDGGGDEEPHRGNAGADERLRERVEGVEKRRTVVREVDVERAPSHRLLRSDEGRRLVEVEKRLGQERRAGEERHGHEQPEDRRASRRRADGATGCERRGIHSPAASGGSTGGAAQHPPCS